MKRRLLCLLLAGLLLLSGCGKLTAARDKLLDKGFELFFGDEAQQQLLHALADGNYEALREAVEAGADVDALKPAVVTGNPLFYIISVSERMGWDLYGNCTNDDLSEYLLDQGADPNWANSRGQTLLMLCCGCDGNGYMGADRLLEQLLAHGADVSLTDRAGRTALDYAVQHGEDLLMEQLLSHGAVPTAQTVEMAFAAPREAPYFADYSRVAALALEAYETADGTPELPAVLIAAAHGDTAAVIAGAADCPQEDRAMLAQLAAAYCGAEAVRALEPLGYYRRDYGDGLRDDTAKYAELAIQNGREESAVFLMERCGMTDLVGLRNAISCGRTDMARLFLERGALEGYVPTDLSEGFDWEIFDNLLSDAARTGDPALAGLLLDYGCPTNDLSLAQALNNAIVAGSPELVRFLCEQAGADPAYLPEGIDSALRTACLHGDVELMEYLVSRGADVTAEGDYLDAAALKHHTGAVDWLLEQGADPNGFVAYEDGSRGSPPLITAIQQGRLDLVELLVEAGADVNGRDAWSGGRFETALICAARSGSWRIVDCLLQHGAEVNAPDHDGATPLDWAATPAVARVLEAAGGKTA